MNPKLRACLEAVSLPESKVLPNSKGTLVVSGHRPVTLAGIAFAMAMRPRVVPGGRSVKHMRETYMGQLDGPNLYVEDDVEHNAHGLILLHLVNTNRLYKLRDHECINVH